jgi:hypothetical protein
VTVPGSSSRGIFLSYRREDAGPYARLLKFQLSERFPDAQVFMDLDSIEAGLDFAEVIAEAVDLSAVLVALIGRQWATLADEQGQRRLDDPDDLVRFEVNMALEHGIRVIPVLVDGARPLRQQQLPSELSKLARLNALEVSYGRYDYDAGRLLDLIDRVLAAAPGIAAAAKVSPENPSGKGALYAKFWERFLEDLKARHPDWTPARKAPPDNWLSLPSPFKGSNAYSVNFPSRPPRLRVELYIDSADPAEVETRFGDLYQHRDEIEAAFGGELSWEALNGRRASRIATYTEGDVAQADRHDEFVEWFIGSLEKLRSALDSYA